MWLKLHLRTGSFDYVGVWLQVVLLFSTKFMIVNVTFPLHWKSTSRLAYTRYVVFFIVAVGLLLIHYFKILFDLTLPYVLYLNFNVWTRQVFFFCHLQSPTTNEQDPLLILGTNNAMSNYILVFFLFRRQISNENELLNSVTRGK